MKINHGFISNSSTTSYLVILSQDTYDEIITNISNDAFHVADSLLERKKIGDLPVIYIDFVDDEEGWELSEIKWDVKDEDEDYWRTLKAWSEFFDAAVRSKKGITKSEGR